MARLRCTDGRYEARCAYCGAWQKVEPRQMPCDTFFENYAAHFTCCGQAQVAHLSVEKDELDFH